MVLNLYWWGGGGGVHRPLVVRPLKKEEKIMYVFRKMVMKGYLRILPLTSMDIEGGYVFFLLNQSFFFLSKSSISDFS